MNCELIKRHELLPTVLQHLHQAVQTPAHLPSAVVPDDKRHLELRVLLQFVELPGMEVGHEVAVLLQHPAHHPVVECLRQVMQREPEQREAYQRCHRGRDLHHPVLHEPRARSRQVHVPAGDEGRVERRVIAVAHALDLRLHHGEHPGLSVAIDGAARHALHDLLRAGEVGLLRLPVIHAVAGHLMPLVHDALHHLRRMLRKVTGTEERGFHAVILQDIQDTVRTLDRHLHALLQREIHAMLARHVKLLGIKTQ